MPSGRIMSVVGSFGKLKSWLLSAKASAAARRVRASGAEDKKGPEVKKAILAYLSEHNAMTLATASENVPWAAPVFYVNDGFDLYFLSKPEARHSQNLMKNPRAAAAIHGDPWDWRKVKGLQIEGEVKVLDGPDDMSRAVKLYVAKFPYLRAFLASSQAFLGVSLQEVRFYKLVPYKIRLIDNEKGFGHREEYILGSDDNTLNWMRRVKSHE